MNIVKSLYLSSAGIFMRKIINTFRLSAWLLGKAHGGEFLRKRDALIWEKGEHHKTDVYSSLGFNATMFIDYMVKRINKNDSILDVCCNQGRFLFDLQSKRYKNLYGFDIMGTAIDTIKKREDYNPKIMHIEHCLAQDYFQNKQKNQFDWAITYSATIELIHPEFNIFKELSRTVRKGMILVINERGHAYPRFYRLLHRIHGFKILETKSLDDKTLIYSIKI